MLSLLNFLLVKRKVICGVLSNVPLVSSHLYWWDLLAATDYIFHKDSHSTQAGILLILTSGPVCKVMKGSGEKVIPECGQQLRSCDVQQTFG